MTEECEREVEACKAEGEVFVEEEDVGGRVRTSAETSGSVEQGVLHFGAEEGLGLWDFREPLTQAEAFVMWLHAGQSWTDCAQNWHMLPVVRAKRRH